MSIELSTKQKKNLKRLADLIDKGNVAIVEYLMELEDKMESEIPSIKDVISRVKGDKGDAYVLTDKDKKEVASIARAMVNDAVLAEEVRKMITIPVEEIARKAAQLITVPVPKDGVSPSKAELEALISPMIPEIDIDSVTSQVSAKVIEETKKLINQPDTAEDIRNKLELLEGDERLDVKAIKGIEQNNTALTNDLVNRAIGIVDQRTSFLINKVTELDKKGGGGASKFTALTDAPSSYTGSAGKAVYVNGTETALVFQDAVSSDEKVKYDAADASAGYLGAKTVAGTGITLAEGTGGDADKLKITNSAPDQTVAFTGGTNVTIGGTYPNFSITDNSLSTSTAASTYVPYTGATTDVDLNGKVVKNFFISKTADATAKMVFDVSAIATATTRTITVPNRSLTLDNITSATTTNYSDGSVLYTKSSLVKQDNAGFNYDDSAKSLTLTGGTAQSNFALGLKVNSTNDGSATGSFTALGGTDNYLIHTDTANNRVGIGTQTPAYKFDVNGIINTNTKVQTPEIKTNATSATDLTITCGTAKTVVLATTVYNDIILVASNLRAGASAPTMEVFQDGIYALRFANATTDIVYGAFEIPHDYKEGTDLEVHCHWSPDSTNTGNCVFNFEYSVAAMAGTFGTSATKTLTDAGSGTINKHQYATGNTVISGSGIGIGTVIAFAFSRPTGDGFTGNAFVHSIGIHYQADTMGSRSASSK